MSNSIHKLKRSKTVIKKKEITNIVKHIRPNGSMNNKVTDFKNRVIPKSLYLDVKNGLLTVTEADKTIGETPVSFKVAIDDCNVDELLAYLEGLDESEISKVILDNTTDFKIMSFTEFVDRVRASIVSRNVNTKLDDSQSPVDETEVQ